MSKIKEWFQSLVDIGIIPQLPANIDCATYEQYAKYLESENAELRARLEKAIELPCLREISFYGAKVYEVLYIGVSGRVYSDLYYENQEQAAESRLVELKGEK